MLGSYGIQPVTLVFNNSKNCFLHLSPNLISLLCLREVCMKNNSFLNRTCFLTEHMSEPGVC